MAPSREPARIPFEDVAFRYSNYDTPFWVRTNSSVGRWHTRADGPTQYLSVSVDGAWGELLRAEGLRTEAEVKLVRMPMWVAEVHAQNIADYSTFEAAEDVGFPADALVDDDYARCQVEGRRLRALGFRGVLAPSAALPGALNLTLFGPRIAAQWGVAPVLASAVPTTKIAVGSPPEGIVGRVRHAGAPHVLLEEHNARRDASPASPDDRGGGEASPSDGD